MRASLVFGVVLTALAALFGLSGELLAQEYKSYNEAMAAAGRLMRDRQIAATQAPLEAALRLATTDRERMNVYNALTPAYRMLPDIEKMMEAKDYLIRHSDQKAGRSVNATDLAGFLHQRGKTDEGIKRLEAKLKQDPKDIVALSVLSVVYTRIKRDAARGEALTNRCDEAGREIAAKTAERNEKDAETAPRTAAWYLKDAAVAWLEAGDNAKALAAAKKSEAAGPEARSEQLALYWHEGLGDVFNTVGERDLALKHYEAAAATPINEILKKGAVKKLADLKAGAGGK